MTLDPNQRWRVDCSDCLPWMQQLPDRYASVVITSPPYEAARTYGVGFKLRGQSWVDWMIPRVLEMCRVSAGLVCINMAGQVRDFQYSPVVEWLVSDLTRNCGIVCGPSPYVYYRSGTPGSGSKHYHRRDWEPVYCFALPDRLPLGWSDNTATGHVPKWEAGGAPSNRMTNGKRMCDRLHTKTMPDGTRKEQGYIVPDVSNSGNVVKCLVGGGALGSPLAHESEAPMSLTLAEFFVRSYAAPGSIVVDPFNGSGTTLHAALKWDRRGHGCELRQAQVDIANRRLGGETTLYAEAA